MKKYTNYTEYLKIRNRVIKELHTLDVKIASVCSLKKTNVNLEKSLIKWRKTKQSREVITYITDKNLLNDIKFLMENYVDQYCPYLLQSRDSKGNKHGISRFAVHKILEDFGPRKKFVKNKINYDKTVSSDDIAVYFNKMAVKRGIEFTLSDEEVRQKVFENCYYCNSKPSQYQYQFGKKLNGLDRIDSKLGYTYENTVPCCGFCNRMKNAHDAEKFLSKIQAIFLNRVFKNYK